MINVQRGYVEITGQLGDPDGEIHIYDDLGEVVTWTMDEWKEDPSLVFVIARAILETTVRGTNDFRTRIGKFERHFPDNYDYRFWWRVQKGWEQPTYEQVKAEWDRNPPVFEDIDGHERLAESWFGFPPTKKKQEIWHWLDDLLEQGLGRFIEQLEEDYKDGR